ncbi:MAG: hypothetical protein CVT66_11135 [Actinobacteria bacterium HGW-Actinobacteria-6]|nr:MAG: hypothetical protein CVT66_11135 [Actinobacteria bacterium HGW-Actinobacteria-6]
MSLVRQGTDVAIIGVMNDNTSERPRRRPLIPKWLIITAAAIVLVIIGAVVAVILTMRNGLIAVPAVVGKTTAEGIAVLDSADLVVEEGGEWYSVTVPKGAIISQEPSAGALVRRGDTITIIVSAGSETFVMPDVVGRTADEATLSLEALGLLVTTETVETSATEGTVTESYPTAGQDVRSGSTVRLRIAGRSVASEILLPYEMQGVTIILDPVPLTSGSDTTMEVARRVRALLEASGAKVVVTRSVTSTATSTGDRAALVAETTATALVTFEVVATGQPGLQVTTVQSGDASQTTSASKLANTMTETLRAPGQIVQTPAVSASAILAATKIPGVRLVLGNSRDQADSTRFADPAWADTVARAVYRALGDMFGTSTQ